MFIVFVVGIAGTHRISVMVVKKIRVKQQIAVIGKLIGVIVRETIIRVHLVIGHLMLCSEAGVFAVKVVAALGKSLVTLGVDADAIEVIAIIKTVFGVKIHLSAETGFLQCLEA